MITLNVPAIWMGAENPIKNIIIVSDMNCESDATTLTNLPESYAVLFGAKVVTLRYAKLSSSDRTYE